MISVLLTLMLKPTVNDTPAPKQLATQGLAHS